MARYFDGVDDYIRITHTTQLEPQQFTVMAWFYATAHGISVTREIFHKQEPSPWYAQANISWELQSGQSQSNVFSRVAFTDGTISDIRSGFLPLNTWIHAAAVWNGTQHLLYINGILVASNNVGAKTLQYSSGYNWFVGRDRDGGNNLFIGNIAEVRFYGRALSQEEIRSEMFRRTPAKEGLLIYLPLWERSGGVRNLSSLSLEVTTFGTTYADDPPMVGGSLVAP